jgi:hypothetical protein
LLNPSYVANRNVVDISLNQLYCFEEQKVITLGEG